MLPVEAVSPVVAGPPVVAVACLVGVPMVAVYRVRGPVVRLILKQGQRPSQNELRGCWQGIGIVHTQPAFAIAGITNCCRVRFTGLATYGSLQVKTGELDESELQNRGGFFARLLQPASDASGVDVEILQAGMEEDKSLAEVITENGGDLGASKDAMRAFFAEQGLEGEALDQRVDGFFNGATQ